MANLTLLLIQVLIFDVLLESGLNLIVSTFRFKLTLSKFYILTLHRYDCFTNFNVLLYLSLSNLDIAGCALNLNFVVKFHNYPVRLFHFRDCLAMGTRGSSCSFQ
jgi:hypothetical protein